MSLALRLAVYTDAPVVGGAERALATLLGWLGPHVDVTLLGVDAGVVAEIAAARPACATAILPPVRNKGDLRAIGAHLRAIRRARPEVLHANLRTPFSCQYAIAAALVTPGVEVVAVEHSPISSTDALQRRLRRLLVQRYAAHIAVAERSARTVEKVLGLDRGSVRTIYNGVADEHSEPVERIAPGPVVGVVGRLSVEKGVDVLLRALEELPEATGLIVGDGPERAALERLAEELGIAGRVHFTGSTNAARGFLGTIDVLALPSRFEALPLTVVEAMYAERPVVATDVGSVNEAVIDGETGLLVPAEDPRALARAIGSLLRDHSRAKALGVAGRKRALEHFSASGMALAYEELYAEVRK